MGREYENSHPWLSFKIDLAKASSRLWITFGEAQSKCHHIAGVPLRPDLADELHRVYLARGMLATTAIEGNTLTEQEVRARIEKQASLPPSREYLGREIDNVLKAFNLTLNEAMQKGTTPITRSTIESFDAIVLEGLEVDENVVPGKMRHHSVGVGTYRGAPWQDCEYLVERLCEWLNGPDFMPSQGDEIIYGLIKSIVAHVYIAWIHPFGDGNGRTARLMEAKFLLEADIPSPAAHLLSNHYNLTRSEYYRQLDRTSASKGDLLPFIEYAMRGYVDQLREQITSIQNQQLQISWQNYLHEKFRNHPGATARRQRELVMALSHQKDVVKLGELTKLTPEVAATYANKTTKTLSRDLNALLKMDLIAKTPQGFRARTERMLTFLPQTLKRANKAIQKLPEPPPG